MLAVDTNVPLGRLTTAASVTAWPRHRLLHLSEPGIIVVPTCRAGNGWQCHIVASPAPWTGGHPTLTGEQLSAAAASIRLDPTGDPEAWALLWQARVFQHSPGGRIPALAHHCAQRLRIPGQLHLTAAGLNDHAAIAARLPNTRPPAVRCLLHRLATAGFLTWTPHGTRLALPTEA